MDPAVLTWMLRVQETEALINTRHGELRAARARQAALELRLEGVRGEEAAARLALLRCQASLAGAKAGCLETAGAAGSAEKALGTVGAEHSRLDGAARGARERVSALGSAADAERSRMAKFEQAAQDAEAGACAVETAARASSQVLAQQLQHADSALMALRTRCDTRASAARTSALRTRSSTLDGEVAAAEGRLQVVRERRAGLAAEVAACEAQLALASKRSELHSLQTEATRMTCEVGVLSDQLESAERRLQSLREEIARQKQYLEGKGP